MFKIYTGVGARKTPADILDLMGRIASAAAERGAILRSGGAKGADTAFEVGALRFAENFEGLAAEIYRPEEANEAAMEIAARYHPAWHQLSSYVKRLHARNAFQVLGADLNTPSECLICWTPDGCCSHQYRSIRTGGTGTAISIASENGIPVFNLFHQEHQSKWLDWLLPF